MPHAGGLLDQPQAWIEDMRALSLYEELHDLQAQRPDVNAKLGKDDDQE